MPRGNAARKRAEDNRMDLRLEPEHKDLIKRAAAYSGESITNFAVSTLVSKARRVVREHETTTLTAADRDRFIALIDNPPKPNQALRRAAKSHRELISRSE